MRKINIEIIVMTITVMGKQLQPVNLEASVFKDGGGVRKILDNNPEAEVIIKLGETEYSYKFLIEDAKV